METWGKRLHNAWLAIKGEQLTIKGETLTFNGFIRAFTVPFETEEEYRYWWLPETTIVDGHLVIVRPARMTQKEKNRYLAAEHHNILTQNGRSQILGFIGSPVYANPQTPFAQYFAVGTFSPFAGATSGDTVVNGEIARVVPSIVTLTGTQADISSFFGISQGNGNWTNVGLFGNNATSTLTSGTLMTHSAFAYPKTSAGSATCDYLINLL